MHTHFIHLLIFLALTFNVSICIGQVYKHPQKKNITQQDSVSYEKKNQRIEDKNALEQVIRHSADLEVDGLIVDETITKVGRDFYQLFHMKWEAPPGAKNFSILIKEFPSRSNGALLNVTINETVIFEQNLQPRYDMIEEMAGYAVDYAYGFLIEDQLNKQLEAEGKKEKEVH